jgi:uncharacterized membrane protein
VRKTLLLAGLGLALLAVGLSVWAYPSLPERVPTSWDLAGHVSGYHSRLFAAALMPAFAVFTLILMSVLPAISPRGYRFDGAATAFYEAALAAIALFVAVHFILLRAAMTGAPPSIALIFALIGLLMVVLGNLIGKVPKNFFMGIRTPWTLVSDEIWSRTNLLAGRLMAIGGVLVIASSAVTNLVVPALLVVVVAIVAIPFVYSYVLYRRIEG